MAEQERKNGGNILKITKTEQYRTVDELLERSRPNSVYFTLLVLSVVIVASGLLLESPAIVIGGMLVTPVLTPVLAMALGIAVGEERVIKDIGVLLGKSFGLILAGSLIIAVLFGSEQAPITFPNTIITAVLYFLVALTSGVAATVAWTRKELSEVLPGISIAVTLVPPLALTGIWLWFFNFELVRFYFIVFFLNLFGVIMGSLIIFSLLKFHKAQKEVEKEVKQAEAERKEAEKKTEGKNHK